MLTKKNKLDQLYVASPCTTDWEAMPGTEQVRFCNQCNLHVYNISAMTRKQAEAVIAETEGRLCTKLYRRADGTIITRDCPIGLRAVRRRVTRAASATLSAALSLFTNQTIGWASEPHKNCQHYKAKITRLSTTDSAQINGTVADINGAVIAKAEVILIDKQTKRNHKTKTDEEGRYYFPSLPVGTYSIEILSPGFAAFKKPSLKIKSREALQLDVEMQVGTMGETVFLPDRLNGTMPDRVRRP
jgi:hypothetical protein